MIIVLGKYFVSCNIFFHHISRNDAKAKLIKKILTLISNNKCIRSVREADILLTMYLKNCTVQIPVYFSALSCQNVFSLLVYMYAIKNCISLDNRHYCTDIHTVFFFLIQNPSPDQAPTKG